VLDTAGFVSICARTKDVMKLTGGEGGATGSFGPFGLEGNLPRLPFKSAVLTTKNKRHVSNFGHFL